MPRESNIQIVRSKPTIAINQTIRKKLFFANKKSRQRKKIVVQTTKTINIQQIVTSTIKKKNVTISQNVNKIIEKK